MTNYNKRLEEILANLGERHIMVEHRLVHLGMPEQNGKDIETIKSKQAITSLIKQLVTEAKPSKKHVGDEVAENRSYTGERLFNATIDEYHSSLLKALEEV